MLNNDSEIPDDSGQILETAIVDIISHSHNFVSSFLLKCKGTQNSGKKAVKDAYFHMIGYSTIFMTKPKREHSCLEKKTEEEKEEAFQKLYRLIDDGSRNTSYWRKELLLDVCKSRCEHIGCSKI